MLRNITLSAEESVIEAARERAHAEHRSLNAVFRDWLEAYVHDTNDINSRLYTFHATMDKLSYINPGKKISRDELNER